jgi:dCTP deaminase
LILSGADVRQYIKFGGLKFEPELGPDQFQQNGIDMVLESAEVGSVAPGQFVLGRTREVVTMPNDLMAFVHLRSTWARHGYIIPPTVIDAGFHGSITLEIAKFVPAQLALFDLLVTDRLLPPPLPVGQRFAHIIFAKLSTPSAPYDGKYQGQIDITHARKD